MRSECLSTPSEIKRTLQPDSDNSSGGPVLYYQNSHYWKYTSEGHLIFVGMSGSGKSRRGTIPLIKSILKAKESHVTIDPKGEIYRATASSIDDEYTVIVLDFRDIFRSACCNILAAPAELFRSGDPKKKQVALEMIDDLAHTLYPVSEYGDPFWQESARSVFVGAVYAIMECAKPEEINMASVYQFIAKGDERMGMSTCLKEFVSNLPENSIASMLLHSYLTTASDTRGGIRSCFLEGISLFARSEGLMSMMASDDLHINQLDGETPTAIYIILPDESPIYDKICTVLIGQLMGHYIRMAQDVYGGRLPRRVNFLVEEAGNVGRIGSLGHLLSAGRSRNVRVQLVLQNFSQLDALYGRAEATTIRSNADVLVAYRTNHWETLCEFSNKCGERQIEENGHILREPLIMPSQLAAMKTGQALVMVSGATKFISWLPDYTEMFDCRDQKEPEFPSYPHRPKPATFHLPEYVKSMKMKKMTDLLSSGPSEKETDSRRDSLPFPPRPKISDRENSFFRSHVDRMIESIDAQIAALQEEEARQKAEEARKKEEKAKAEKNTFTFDLIDFGGTKGDLIKAIRDHTDTSSLKKAKELLELLPHTFTFPTQAEAERARSAILRAGGVVSGICSTEKEKADSYNIVLVSINDNRPSVLKALKDLGGMSLRDAISAANSLPYTISIPSLDKARELAACLKELGAQIIRLNF